MDLPVGIPRSRGAICGLLLILLGLWGGLAPFVGPYLHFGIAPDKAWAYNSGRLYYSIVPGAAVLLGGILVLLTRNRAIGFAGGLLAALGGAWFALGQGLVVDVLKKTSIVIGAPIGSGFSAGGGFDAGGGVTVPIRVYLEEVTLFGGLGVLIVLVGALAIGRFSMLAAKDVAADTAADSYTGSIPVTPLPMRVAATGSTPFPSETDQYSSPSGTFTQPSSAPPGLFPQTPYPDAPSQYQEP
jgi:hypothetical protein